jgi:hypothetical protein
MFCSLAVPGVRAGTSLGGGQEACVKSPVGRVKNPEQICRAAAPQTPNSLCLTLPVPSFGSETSALGSSLRCRAADPFLEASNLSMLTPLVNLNVPSYNMLFDQA